MAGYGTMPAQDVEVAGPLRVGSERRTNLKVAAAVCMVLLAATAVVVATRGTGVSSARALRVADVEAVQAEPVPLGPTPRRATEADGPSGHRDDPTYNAYAHSKAQEPHHKNDGPQTLYFHSAASKGHDDAEYIASLAAKGDTIESTQGKRMTAVNDHAVILHERQQQDMRGSFHRVAPSVNAPKFDESSNIMTVLKQYETQVESASSHLEKLSHAEQTDAAASAGNGKAIDKLQRKYDGEFQGMHTELEGLESKMADVESKVEANNAVMTKLETVMEDVYYEAHSDHDKVQKIEKSELQKKYTPPAPWAKVGKATAPVAQDDDVDDDYYYDAGDAQ